MHSTAFKKFIPVAAVIVVLVAGFYLLSLQVRSSNVLDRFTETAGRGMTFEVATTTAAQERGLGGRASIPDNYGMLFVFPKDDTYGFWMKDMLVPIDIIWLANNGRVIKIDASVSPSTYPNVFYPPYALRYVLETRAGFAKEQGWGIGTQVHLPKPYGEEL